MESSILRSENTLNNVECLFHSQPTSGIINSELFPRASFLVLVKEEE
jgi:hypothetical protein